MFCPECGRDLKENEVCHCQEEIPEQPKVIGIVDDTPRFGVLDTKENLELERMKKEFEKEQKNKKERKKKNENKKS